MPSSNVDERESALIHLVLDSVTSPHSRRSYEKGSRLFFAWVRDQSREQPQPSFTKALVGAYRSWLLAQGLAPATINLRLLPVRKLARRWPSATASLHADQSHPEVSRELQQL